jgi:localization factor PodJL
MGASGPVDNDSAATWFTKAAEYGVKDSQYNLGILAAKGLGVKQNLEESYKWFALAAKAGDKDAASKRDEIANAMRPEQLAKARAATDLWKAKDAEPAVNAVEIPDSWKESPGQTASVGEPPVNMKKAIRNIQLILAKNGYDAGAPDGVMGGKTTKAIAAYQAANGMKSTGEVDEALVRSLLAKAK